MMSDQFVHAFQAACTDKRSDEEEVETCAGRDKTQLKLEKEKGSVCAFVCARRPL